MPISSKKLRNQLPKDATENNFSIGEGSEYLYELPQEEDAFIPVEEWSKCKEINKKEEAPATKHKKMTIENVEDKHQNMKNCRFCSKEINSNAVKCQYCGRILTERTNKRIFIA
jgi:hypothetical protein